MGAREGMRCICTVERGKFGVVEGGQRKEGRKKKKGWERGEQHNSSKSSSNNNNDRNHNKQSTQQIGILNGPGPTMRPYRTSAADRIVKLSS